MEGFKEITCYMKTIFHQRETEIETDRETEIQRETDKNTFN